MKAMTSSFPRSLTSALGQTARRSMSGTAGSRFVSPSYTSSSLASSSSSSSSQCRFLNTTLPTRARHNSDESPARSHRRPLAHGNHEEFSEQPTNNATRDQDLASDQHHESISTIESTFQRDAEGRNVSSFAEIDPAKQDPDAAQQGVTQALNDLEQTSATSSPTPRPMPTLQPGGYGYSLQTLPTKSQPTLELLINMVMKDGKKATAQRKVLGAVKYLSEALNTDPLPAIREAIIQGSPMVRFKRLYLGGGKIVQCPIPLTEKAGMRKSVAALIQVAERRSELKFEVRLAKEILGILEGSSGVLKKKEEIHKEGTRQRGNLNLPPSSFK